ncbi:MAG TPA: carbonic anhydrase [Polyangiaceae bacterium]|nr:carbonic anhydrase [Polyangiaceae bacterium]
MVRATLVLLGLAAVLPGCDKVAGLIGSAKPAASGSAAPGEGAKPPEAAASAEAKDGEKEASDDEFALPFAWENSATEPLGRTRSFLKDMLLTNGDYMSAAAKLFPTFADKQTPRATVLTCADSRVQTTAFDASPENDDFLVRNIGNQVDNAAGSIEYGVEQLNTPLLLILGHTGCGAVKASMGGADKLPKSVQTELKGLHPHKHDPKKKLSDDDALTWGVIDNVHDQVNAALSRFGKRVHSGRLTVVGAVLDLRNDMGLGAGRIILVDVNGNQDQKRIAAFIEAVTGKPAPEAPSAGKDEEADSKRAQSTQKLLHALAALPPASSKAAHGASAPEGAAHEHGAEKTASRSSED